MMSCLILYKLKRVLEHVFIAQLFNQVKFVANADWFENFVVVGKPLKVYGYETVNKKFRVHYTGLCAEGSGLDTDHYFNLFNLLSDFIRSCC